MNKMEFFNISVDPVLQVKQKSHINVRGVFQARKKKQKVPPEPLFLVDIFLTFDINSTRTSFL